MLANYMKKGSSSRLFNLALIGLIIFGVLSLIIFYKATALNKTTPTDSLEKIKIGNIGEYTIFNIIAKEKGFFTKNGLDATVIEYPSGPDAINALLSGQVDFAVAADFVGTRNIFTSPQLRILAQTSQHRVFQLVVRKDHNIAKPSDIKGKEIGFVKSSAGEFFFKSFLTANQLQLHDVTMINLAPALMVNELEKGTLDAVVIFEPHIYNLKKKMGDKILTWDIQGNQNVSALSYTTSSLLEKNPSLADRYIQSLVDAERFYNDYPEEVKQLFAKELGYDDEYIAYSWPRFSHAMSLNQELLLNMENEARWLISNGLTTTKKVPNYLNYIYFAGVEKAKPNSITIIR